MVTPKVTNRYPRPGERVAPYTLREFLLEPLPVEFRAQCGADLKLCDLDETVWERFPAELLNQLAEVVVERVSTYHVRKAFLHRHFPRPPAGISIADLHLENRTRRCLAREGFDEHPDRLGDHTIGEVLAIRAFGPRCLVDLLSALESRRGAVDGVPAAADQSQPRLAESLTAEARRLAQLPDVALARCEDPRFAALIRAVDVDSRTAEEAAQRLLSRVQDPPDPPYVAGQVRQLREYLERMSQLTLEEELIQVFTSGTNPRNAEILIGYYGWADGKQHTLTEVGNRFAITRERIRQICAKLTKRPKGLPPLLAPVMDRALAMVAGRLPGPAADIEAELRRRGWTSVGMPLENLITAARLLGRRAEFRVVEVAPHQKDSPLLAVHSGQAHVVSAVVDAARKDAYFHGLAAVDEIQRALAVKFAGGVSADLVRQTLQLLEGFCWLEEKSGWFHIDGVSRHGLPKMIDKVLAVAGAVTVAELRTAMRRNRRLWKDPPPEDVLLAFCRHLPQVRTEGRRIISDPPRDWRTALTGVELKLVRMLKEHGPVMERGAMEDFCVTEGMNRFSFHAFVSWSPVIVQFGHSLYGLLGTEVPHRKIEALTEARRAGRTARRVLCGHGATEDGKLWLSYRLSKAASTYAVITVPAALKQEVRGRFVLLGPDGREIGTLATKDGRAWGLGAFLRQRGARAGDAILLTLDLTARTATVCWSQEE
ncbi:MAG: sigma factor-like helix-turn-helix DNA-binding protein [Thermoguttaceae bacterium]